MSKRQSYCCALFCSLLLAPGTYSQIRSGTITGAVLDPSGSVVPDAEVTVKNTGTNASYTTKTTAAGLYTVPYLESGTYSVSISRVGFTAFLESGIHLDPSQTARVDAKLQVGSVGSMVEVAASAEQLQADSSTVTGATDAQVIEAIPNITQNPLFYAM